MIKEARHSVGRLLAPERGVSYAFEPDEHVTLFTNTTSAFARVLSRIERDYAGSDPTLLTTDLEYPGCVAAIDDSWSGPVVMTRVTRSLVGSSRPDKVLSEALIHAHNFVKPRVVFVSHVMRSTGQVLSPKTLRYIRELNPRAIIVLDGSQAIGNIVVERELLELADFYIASGHKWLGGLTTSGFVWSRDPKRWIVADPAQAFAYPGQLGGSGNAAAWASLVGSIEDMTREKPQQRLETIATHNRALGKVFVEGLASVESQVDIVTPLLAGRPRSGLVTIGVAPISSDRVIDNLTHEGFTFSLLDSETVHWRSHAENRFLLYRDPDYPVIERAGPSTAVNPEKARVDLRFCFHYWHGEKEVRALTDSIVQALRGRRRPPVAVATSS
jgi:selenocysteine lyase/cysteine desulfurase